MVNVFQPVAFNAIFRGDTKLIKDEPRIACLTNGVQAMFTVLSMRNDAIARRARFNGLFS